MKIKKAWYLLLNEFELNYFYLFRMLYHKSKFNNTLWQPAEILFKKLPLGQLV